MTRAFDFGISVLIAFLTMGLYFSGINALEFFRHTEADRTLIAWEMYESKNYLVPHLLHSPILTKPPLYYWLLSSFISYFGSAEEWVVRLPSVISAGVFSGGQFLLLRALGASRGWSIFGAVVVATGASFQELATLAEIDTLLGLLSAFSFGLGFLAIERRSLVLSLSTGLVLGLSFLVKGPPTLIFYLSGIVLFFFWAKRYPQASEISAREFRVLLRNQIATLIAGTGPVALWLWKLSDVIGFDSLKSQFVVQILDRALSDNAHPRGPFFYLATFCSCILPWSLLIFAALYQSYREKKVLAIFQPGANRFLVWNLCILLPSLFLLSLSTGKSNRYFFPLYAVSANLVFLSARAIRGTSAERILFYWGRVIAVAAIVTSLFIPVFIKVNGISQSLLWVTALTSSLMFAGLFFAFLKNLPREMVFSLCCLTLLFQFGKVSIFAPQRNAQRSVKAIAAEINFLVPKNQLVFTIELFDRWINYYLKRIGKDSMRLTPAVATELRPHIGPQYLLLDTEHEGWRLEQIKANDPGAAVIREFHRLKSGYVLVRTNGAELYRLKLHEEFPTVPSVPQ